MSLGKPACGFGKSTLPLPAPTTQSGGDNLSWGHSLKATQLTSDQTEAHSLQTHSRKETEPSGFPAQSPWALLSQDPPLISTTGRYFPFPDTPGARSAVLVPGGVGARPIPTHEAPVPVGQSPGQDTSRPRCTPRWGHRPDHRALSPRTCGHTWAELGRLGGEEQLRPFWGTAPQESQACRGSGFHGNQLHF